MTCSGRRQRPAGPVAAREAVCGQDLLAEAVDRGPGARDRPVHQPGPRAAPQRSGLCRVSADPRDRSGAGRGVRRRDRRHHPVLDGAAAGVLGRVAPQAPRVRHPCPTGPDHQARVPAGPVGCGGVGPDPAQDQPGRQAPSQIGSGSAAAATSAWSPLPANRSSTSSTRCVTITSERSTVLGRRHDLITNTPCRWTGAYLRSVAGRAGHDPRATPRRGRPR